VLEVCAYVRVCFTIENTARKQERVISRKLPLLNFPKTTHAHDAEARTSPRSRTEPRHTAL